MARHAAVAEVAVFGVPDAQWGETPVAAVTLREGETVGAEEIRDWVNERVEARFQKLSSVIVLDEFPRNAAGKTLRRELRDMVCERGGTIVRDGFVETNGIRMHYLDHGGEGPVLVLASRPHRERPLLRRARPRGADGRGPRARARHARPRRERRAGVGVRDRGSCGRCPRAPRRARARPRRDRRPLVRRAAGVLARREPSRSGRTMRRDRCARGARPGDDRPDQAVARPPRPRLPVVGRLSRARQVDAVLRRGRLGRRRRAATSAPTCGCGPTGPSRHVAVRSTSRR